MREERETLINSTFRGRVCDGEYSSNYRNKG